MPRQQAVPLITVGRWWVKCWCWWERNSWQVRQNFFSTEIFTRKRFVLAESEYFLEQWNSSWVYSNENFEDKKTARKARAASVVIDVDVVAASLPSPSPVTTSSRWRSLSGCSARKLSDSDSRSSASGVTSTMSRNAFSCFSEILTGSWKPVGGLYYEIYSIKVLWDRLQ